MTQERGIFASFEQRSFIEKKENPNSLGVAVLIVGLDPNRNGENMSDPLIWTITELKDKTDTDKHAGQISIPAETRKNGESVDNNVLGALAEFCDDTVFSSYVKRHLVKMDGRWYREKGIIVGAGPADVAVMIYDGALDFPFKPTNKDEVSPNGWVKKSELARTSGLRDLFNQVIELDDEENLVKDVLENYYNNPEKRKSVFPEDLDSIVRFNAIREFGVDITTMPLSAKEVAKTLPEAHRLMKGTIDLLVESQRQWPRDYTREEEIVSQLESTLKKMEKGDYAVGISEIKGVEIKSVKVPRKGFKVWGKMRKELTKKIKKDDAELFSSTEKPVRKSWGFWELQRGDSLGYEKDLGKDWYLVFHERINSHAYDNYGIAPVDRIRSFKTRPYEAHGM